MAVNHTGLEMDQEGRTVSLNGRRLALGRREFLVLELLWRERGRTISPSVMLAHAWPDDPEAGIERIRTAVARLRRRLGGRDRIRTIGSEGYELNL